MSGGVVVTIPHLAPWGTEAQTLRLVEVLIGAGWEVRLCCFYGYDRGVVDGFRGCGVSVALFGLQRRDGLRRLVSRLREELRRERPHTLHVQYLTPGLPALVAGRLERVPRVFATVHQTGAGYGMREKALARTSALLASSVLCVSLAVEESWFGSSRLFTPSRDGIPPRHCTIYNAVEPAAPDGQAGGLRVRGELGLEGRDVIGVVGRLTPEKGHATLLRAMPAVRERSPGAVLLVVGSGPEEERLRELARGLGLEGGVVWAGHRSPAETARLYGAMDVVAVPSLLEGFGLVAAEASAAGRPVVASAVGGLPEVIEDGVTGLLVPPRQAAPLAAALARLLGDAQLGKSLGEAGARRAEDRFSLARFADCIRALYGPPAGRREAA